MAVEERDPHSGYLTTGHDWNGIKELNTPVPRSVYFFLFATILFSVVYWVLMPAFPTGRSFTRGLLGVDQRSTVDESLRFADLERSAWTKRIMSEDFAAIRRDPDLMKIVRSVGRALYGDNCAACHGSDARGGKGFPNLTTASWLWGGSPEAIAETIRAGVNSAHKESRISQMLGFGRSQAISREEARNLVSYVESLSNTGLALTSSGSAGRSVFEKHCVTCHGAEGKGNAEVGGPDLTDSIWIYGGDADSIYESIWNGRKGHMPTWEGRMGEVDRKLLTLYLVDLRSSQ